MSTTEQTEKKSRRGLINTVYIGLTLALVLLYIAPAQGGITLPDLGGMFPAIDFSDTNNQKSDLAYQCDSASKTCQITGIGTHFDYRLEVPDYITKHKVTTIGAGAFRGASNVVMVTLPNTVELIGNYAFADCTALNSLTISEGTQRIGSYAFQNCVSLSKITIPASTVYIGPNAFDNCPNLNVIKFGGTISQWHSINNSTKWNKNSQYCLVYCMDGVINLNN